MEEKVLYSMESPFQQEINVKGYYFGKNEGKEHSACIVGALRGNEYQQLYICSKLIDVLKKIEKHGDIVGENGILVIPSVSNMSMDFGKRFWISDDTDLNRLFPGNPSGESGSRVAYAIMETTKGYRYGIHLPSFYIWTLNTKRNSPSLPLKSLLWKRQSRATRSTKRTLTVLSL